MGIVITKDLFCDFCANWVSGNGLKDDLAIRRMAETHFGWQVRYVKRKKRDICSECFKRGIWMR